MVIQIPYFSAYPILRKEIDNGNIPWSKENVITLYDQVCEAANTTFPDFMAEAFSLSKNTFHVIAAGREIVAESVYTLQRKDMRHWYMI